MNRNKLCAGTFGRYIRPSVYMTLIAAVLAVANPARAVNPFDGFGRQLGNAIQRGINQGARQVGAPQTGGSRLGGGSWFGGGPVDGYTDPGPDDPSLAPKPALVGDFRASRLDSIVNSLQDDEVLARASMTESLTAASVQFACLASGMGMMRGTYLKELSQGLGAFDRQRNDPRGRGEHGKRINERVTQINRTLTGQNPLVEMEHGSTVSGENAEVRERRLQHKINQAGHLSMTMATGVVADVLMLNPNSQAAGEYALDVLRTTMEKSGVEPLQSTRCLMTYLEDRYTDRPDEEVLEKYESLLRSSATERRFDQYAMSCPITLSLATRYLESRRYDDATRVLDLGSKYAGIRFDKNDRRASEWPHSACSRVQWLKGVLEYKGLGTAPNASRSGDSFRKCANELDLCAFNLAQLELAGMAQMDGADEPVRLLRYASGSADPSLRTRASDLLAKIEAASEQQAAEASALVCENASSRSEKGGKHPTEQEMCYAYWASMEYRRKILNGAPEMLGKAMGDKSLVALLGRITQQLAGGRILLQLNTFAKQSCNGVGKRFYCTFHRRFSYQTEYGPGPQGRGMRVPFDSMASGYFERGQSGWTFTEPPRSDSSANGDDDTMKRTCMNTTFMTPTEVAVGSAFGGRPCD